MALTRYHKGKNSCSKRIGTKRISKKLDAEIKSLGWQTFSIKKGKNYKVFSSSNVLEHIEEDAKTILKEWENKTY